MLFNIIRWGVPGFLLILALSMGGCGSTTTTYMKDRVSGDMKAVVEDHSFFASENLNTYYKAEAAKSDNHLEAIRLKITAIKENIAARMTTVTMTPTEALLMSVIDSQQLAAIPVDPPPTTTKAPRTATETYDGSFLLNFFNTGLNAYNTNRANKNQSKNDGDDVTIVNSGSLGEFNWHSKNQTGTLNLDGQSSGFMDFSKYKSEAAASEEE